MTAAASPAEGRRPLAVSAAWRLAATVVRVLVGLVAVSLFTRLLGISQWGLLALFQAAVAPLALLDGLGRATVKYVAESLGRGDAGAAGRVVRTALALNAVLGLAGAAALAVAAPWLARSVFAIPAADVAQAILGFRVTAGAWLVGIVTTTYVGVLTGHHRFDTTSRLAAAAVILSTGSGVAAAALTGNVVAVVAVQTAAAAIMLLVYRGTALRTLPEIGGGPRLDLSALGRVVAFWRWEVVGVAGGLLAGWADRYILGAYYPPAIVGYYAAANLLQTQLYAAFLEMGEVLFPAVSHLEGQGELAAARRLSALVGWTLGTAFGVGAAVLGVIGGDFLALWVSPDARSATATLRVLCASSILGVTAVAPLYYTLGLGKTRWDAVSGVVVGVIVTALGLVLIPRLGLLGVGYGLLAGTLARCLVVAAIWRVHFRQDVGLGAFAAHVWAPAVTSIGVLVGLSALHDALAPGGGWPGFLAEAVVVLVVAAALQLGVSEALPGGSARRRDVVASLRPLVARWLPARGAGEA